MDERQVRLVGCFLAIFPELRIDEITKATSTSVETWDSVAGVALLAAVEEEFGISIEVENLAMFNSYDGFLTYLQEVESRGPISIDREAVGRAASKS
jgi:acyl carrier protein